MIKNYLKVTVRYLIRNRFFTLINILGLALGMASCLLILSYILHETGYDAYHADSDRVFRVAVDVTSNTGTQGYAATSPPVGTRLRTDYPQVAYAARVTYFESNRLVEYGEKRFYEEGFLYADEDFLKILTFRFIHGNAETALDRPGVVVLPERLALKYFGEANPMGKVLSINGRDHVVSAVIEDSPRNTHFGFDLFVSMKDLGDPPWMTDWSWQGMYTYIKLHTGTHVGSFENGIRNMADRTIQGDARSEGQSYSFFLQPIETIYLGSNLQYEIGTGNRQRLTVFGAVGLFILIIACINYINLATARSIHREREIGLRKVVGAERRNIALQFLGESLLQGVLAMALGVGLVFLFRGVYRELTSLSFSFSTLFEPRMLMSMAGLVLFVAIAAGAYPGFLMSGFDPIGMLRGILHRGPGRASFRRLLVSGQFVITITMMISTLVVFKQLRYMRGMDKGYDVQDKLILPVRGRAPLADSYEGIKTEFLKNPMIRGAAVSSGFPGRYSGKLRTRLVGQEHVANLLMFYEFYDADFIDLYRMRLIAGRSFDDRITSDLPETCLINQAAVKAFGWKSEQEAIGQVLETGLRGQQKRIIGVLKDFVFRGARFAVEPLVIEMDPPMYNYISLDLKGDDTNQALSHVRQVWDRMFPRRPFQYHFLGDVMEDLYDSETRIFTLYMIFTFLGIFVSSLGLFGLASFTAEQKTKEIGIRKVLGASVRGVVLLLAKRFLIWIIVANAVAWPVAFTLMRRWLENFAFRTNPGIGVFLSSGICSIFIALFSVIAQTMKAAKARPVEALKYE